MQPSLVNPGPGFAWPAQPDGAPVYVGTGSKTGASVSACVGPSVILAPLSLTDAFIPVDVVQ